MSAIGMNPPRGTRVRCIIRETHTAPRYRDRGLGTVEYIHPGAGYVAGVGHVHPFFLRIRWDEGEPKVTERTIRSIALLPRST